MKRFLILFFGNLWALPNTIVSAIYLGVFAILGWVKFESFEQWSIKLSVRPGSGWLWDQMKNGNWAGWSSGAFIVIRDDFINVHRTIIHEERHVLQQYVFGVFQPILYFLASVFIWVFLRSRHSYYDNPFERDARRSAGQRVDIPKEAWRDPNDRWAWW
jgi:hypothetical protein